MQESLAQARPAKTENWDPEKRAANRNNWLRVSRPSRFKPPVDSKTRAEKSKLIPTKPVIFAVFEFFRIIFRGVVACHVGGRKRARDRDVDRQPFPFTPQGNGYISLLGPEGAKSFAQEPQTRQGVSYDLWRVGPQEATRTPVFRASTESALALSDRA